MGVTKQPTRLQSGIQTHIKTDSLKNCYVNLQYKKRKTWKRTLFLTFIRSILSHKDHGDAGNYFYNFFSPIILMNQN